MRAPLLAPLALRLAVTGKLREPRLWVSGLLVEIATACELEGAALIGHIKCHARTAAGSFSCSLVSLRLGAACSEITAGAYAPEGQMGIDLVILVYGLKDEALERITKSAIDAACRAEGVGYDVALSAQRQAHHD